LELCHVRVFQRALVDPVNLAPTIDLAARQKAIVTLHTNRLADGVFRAPVIGVGTGGRRQFRERGSLQPVSYPQQAKPARANTTSRFGTIWTTMRPSAIVGLLRQWACKSSGCDKCGDAGFVCE